MPELNIEKTKKTLGQSIKRPPLSEKLLSKPPYRYLYDIMMEVNNVSGFFTGLFNEEELAAPTKETSKEVKISFLQKVIDVLQSCTGKSIQAKPSKIIAGHEPEKTNEMLQILGQALLDKVSSKEAIEAISNGRKPSAKKKPSEKPTSAKSEVANNEESAAKDATSEKEARRKHRSSRKEAKEDQEEKKEVITNGHSSPDRSHKSDGGKHRDKSGGGGEDKRSSGGETRDKSSKRSRSHHKDKNENDTTDRTQPDHDTSANEHATEADLDLPDQQPPSTQTFKRPSSAKGHRRRQVHADSDGADDAPADQVQQPSKTPDSSDGPPAGTSPDNSAPPAPKKGGGDHKPPPSGAPPSSGAPPPQAGGPQMVQSSMPRPMSSRPAAPRKRNPGNASTEKASYMGSQGSGDSSATTQIIFDKPTNKAHDDSSDTDDDDDVVIVTHDTMHGAMRGSGLEGDHVTEGGAGDGEEHGGLVQKILDTKKKDQEAASSSTTAKTAVTIDKTVLSREQEAISKRTRALQEKLQTLVKSAAPLKQIMNYVQEDVDTMRKELSFWSGEIAKNTEMLHREKQKTDRELAPLYEGLEFLENKVLETTEQIRNKKAAVIQNEQTIHKMLSVTNSTN